MIEDNYNPEKLDKYISIAQEIYNHINKIAKLADSSLILEIAGIISSRVELPVMLKYTDTWQLCPKCNGQGTVSKPPYVQGDQNQWTTSASSFICDVCNGTKIIKR